MTPETGIDAAHPSPVAAQLQRGFPWLRFEPALEKTYRREHYELGLVQLRLNLVLALGLVLAFIAMDRMVAPSTGALVGVLHYGVIVPSLLACLGATWIPHGWRAYARIVAVLAPVVLTAIAMLVLQARENSELALFPVLVLATLFAYYLVGLSFYAAVRTNLIALLAFTGGSSLAGLPADLAAYQAMTLFSANLVGATVAYNLEMVRRMSWLEARLLAEMAERDGLTRTYNRRRLDGHLHRTWQQGTREQCPIALLMIDIDCFKPYNDRYGHQAGDEALKAVAAVLAHAARRPLDFVARYGGEEFVVVLYDTTREYAQELAQHIVEGVRNLHIPHGASDVESILTVSIGVAHVVPTAGRSPEGLVQLADEALYAAKHTGRNRVHVMDAQYEQLRTGYFRLAKG